MAFESVPITEEERGIENLRKNIAAKRHNEFHTLKSNDFYIDSETCGGGENTWERIIDDGKAKYDAKGYHILDLTLDGQEVEDFGLPKETLIEWSGGIDARTMARELDKQGLLVKKEKGRLTAKYSFDGERLSLYMLSTAFDPEPEPEPEPEKLCTLNVPAQAELFYGGIEDEDDPF